MSGEPIYELELRAKDQRRRLQESVSALRSRVREDLDWKRNARQHVWLVSGVLAFVGLLSGYTVTGVFTPN